MKGKYLITASAIMISFGSFAQKDELKAVEKALKSGNAVEAKTNIDKAESLIANADDSQKAQFYYLKGNTYLDLGKRNNAESSKNYGIAAKSFGELIDFEKKSGKQKFSKLAEVSLIQLKAEIQKGAIADYESKKYKDAALKLNQVYELDKKDTLNLYNAALSAISGEDVDLALSYLNELKKLNYTGAGYSYTAVSKLNETTEGFTNAKEMNDAVKRGSHTTPKTERIPSKKGDIYKYISLILAQKGDVEGAKKAVSDARKANPNDDSLLETEANLYLQTNDIAKYEELIKEVVAKKPNDPILFYNLGVVTAQAGKTADAEKFYKKSIELDPKNVNTYLNLAILKFANDKAIVDEMNKLGTTPKENKRYEELKKKKDGMYKDALPYLEKAYELAPDNADVSQTLMNVYNALDMTDKYQAMKAKAKK